MVESKRKHTIHEKDMIINKDRLTDILNQKGMSYADLFHKIDDKYGIDLKYKSFMNLLYNKATWKLLYAWAIVDILKIEMLDVFDIVDIDKNEVLQEKEVWIKKYQE